MKQRSEEETFNQKNSSELAPGLKVSSDTTPPEFTLPATLSYLNRGRRNSAGVCDGTLFPLYRLREREYTDVAGVSENI